MILGRFAIAAILTCSLGAARAESAPDFLQRFQQEARSSDPGFQANARRGEVFFNIPGPREWACRSCHTSQPNGEGKHASTGKTIAPLAPAANPQRFTQTEKVDKWFGRNCKDVLGRSCTPAEKADLLAYLIAQKP